MPRAVDRLAAPGTTGVPRKEVTHVAASSGASPCRQTRRIGRFEYRVTLPTHVDADKIDANLADGVLTVRAPKSERDQRRRIEISRERRGRHVRPR